MTSAASLDREIAQRVRRFRIERGVTQLGLGEALGVTYQQIHKYESGGNRITAGRLVMIARALGVEMAAFFDDLGTAPPEPPPLRRGRPRHQHAIHAIEALPPAVADSLFSLARVIAESGAET